ncbi:phage antirepressor KilAC domain-containing protein [Vagococcus fluvialis]|uniref:phage antirepressor KilAC domain-containing protein n=1 Tax=Vagococcus fluvialis TaxID=2738 RepID=UPI0022E4CBF3|nr:phage antirepressor KilAC domain-containing protein [Vagococcus fluvialis]
MNLQVIDQREVLSKDFKIYGDLDNPLFLAKDVAEWIEHSKVTMMLETIDEDEKLKEAILTSGQNRKMWFLTEDGLYEVLMQSRKPIAKKFKKEVKQILKDIRKHGMYAKEELLDNPDLLIEVATQLKEERNKNELLEQQIAEYEPKISYLDMILSSSDTVATSQIAADYGMSAIALNRILNDLGVQRKVSGQWLLYKHHMNNGYTKSHTSEIRKSDGSKKVVMNTKWTQKGRIFIYDLLKQNGHYPQMDLDDIA